MSTKHAYTTCFRCAWRTATRFERRFTGAAFAPESTTGPRLTASPQWSVSQRRRRDLSAAVRWSEEELSLPMFAELTADEVMRVTDALADVLAEGSG